jgi:hypothetical protein
MDKFKSHLFDYTNTLAILYKNESSIQNKAIL